MMQALRRYAPTLGRLMVTNPGRVAPHGAAWLRARIELRRCTQVGRLPQVWGRVRIENAGQLLLHDRIRIRAIPWQTELVTLPGGSLEIGTGTYINSGVSICACQSVIIGKRCLIGPRVLIIDNDFHVAGEASSFPASLPIVLEDEVWLGAGVIVLKGVRIGRGASVGAGSVVTRDVAGGTVVAGVPARPIGHRSHQRALPVGPL
jgi:acetyltransferase-like isoleucine patch superfamily enzyme